MTIATVKKATRKAVLTLLSAMVTLVVVGASLASAQTQSLGSDKFTDIPKGHWADEAIGWAVENGITTGTSATTFSPNDTLTRAQMLTFLHRYHTNVAQQAATTAEPVTTEPSTSPVTTTTLGAVESSWKPFSGMFSDVTGGNYSGLRTDATKFVTTSIYDDDIATLYIRCSDRLGVETYVHWGGQYVADGASFAGTPVANYRLDNGPKQTTTWSEDTDNEASFFPFEITDLLDRDTMIIEIYDFDDERIGPGTFTLTGLRDALPSECGAS